MFNLVLKRWNLSRVALWIGIIIAALAFGAAHFPSVMILLNVNDPSQLSPALIVYILLLNGVLGLVAGYKMIKDGLVAAMGIHFWADVVWHVLWPLLLAFLK